MDENRFLLSETHTAFVIYIFSIIKYEYAVD